LTRTIGKDDGMAHLSKLGKSFGTRALGPAC
jgi:hypothetical protein